MKKYQKLAIISTLVGTVAFLVVFVRAILGGPEDTWICLNGEWVKHGNPTAAAPNEPCEGM